LFAMKSLTAPCSAVALILMILITGMAGLMAVAPQSQSQSQSQSQPRQRIEVAKLGPQVGERVPDFNLNDQTGKSRTLRSIMGPKGAMLVFVRSADWTLLQNAARGAAESRRPDPEAGAWPGGDQLRSA
jgi:hypothetical protein